MRGLRKQNLNLKEEYQVLIKVVGILVNDTNKLVEVKVV